MTNAPEITTAAEQAIGAAEALPLGADLQAIEQAREAVDTLYEAAAAVLCPANLTPVEPGVLADFSLALSQIPVFEAAGPPLAALHARSVDSHADLAAVVRGPRGQTLVAQRAVTITAGRPGADRDALEAFVTELAKQISVRPNHPLVEPARIVAEQVPSLRARLAAVEQRHAEHAKAEAARRDAEWQRAEAERKERARAAEAAEWAARLRDEDDDMRERRRELAAFFRRHGERIVFTVSGRRLSGDQCAADLKAGAEYSQYYRAQSTGEARLTGVAEQAL